jgi:hypothetical protein
LIPFNGKQSLLQTYAAPMREVPLPGAASRIRMRDEDGRNPGLPKTAKGIVSKMADKE